MDVDGWVRVLVTTPPELADLASDACWEAGAAGIEERSNDGAIELRAGFASSAPARAALAHLAALGLGGIVEPVGDDGLDAWRAHAAAVPAGPFWLVPTWVDPPADADPTGVLHIDPGRTFGSGSHPTTRLVAALLAALVAPGDRVLDVGTGSGVLAVAAARLGAAEVVAIDIDETSPEVVAANAERNGVEAIVRASTTPLERLDVGAGFAVVAANLLARSSPTSPAICEAPSRPAVRWSPRACWPIAGRPVAPLAPLSPERVEVEDGWAAVVLR
ncbi:MAG: 50S ribosomal protein L11 methyltransferase [Acidimicrobiales bacterium]